VRISKYLSRVTINELVMASFTWPIKYCVGYNKESPEALSEKNARVLAWFYGSSRIIKLHNYI